MERDEIRKKFPTFPDAVCWFCFSRYGKHEIHVMVDPVEFSKLPIEEAKAFLEAEQTRLCPKCNSKEES